MTDSGCVTCQEEFQNCEKCYSFDGNGDGSELFETPIYASKDDMTISSYWACKRCVSGFSVDFYNQQCVEDYVNVVMDSIFANQVER